MTIRDRYMFELESMLKDIPEAQRKEWLYDYYIHFQQAYENGQSEEEAARELGDPRLIANELLQGYTMKGTSMDGTWGREGARGGGLKSIIVLIGVAFLNLLVIGPYLGLAAVLLSLWVCAAALFIAGAVTVIESLGVSSFTIIQAASIGLICTSLTILASLGLKVLTVKFCSITLKYVQYNLRLVRGSFS